MDVTSNNQRISTTSKRKIMKFNLTKFSLTLLLLIVIIHLGLNMTQQKLKEKNMATVSELQYETSIANAKMEQRMQEQKSNVMQSMGIHYDKKPYKYPLDKMGNSLLPIKNKVTQYKKTHNKWPQNMLSLGLKSTRSGDGVYIKNIKIHNGEIYAFLGSRFGYNKIIRLYHKPLHPEIWRCASNLRLKGNKEIAGIYCPEAPNISFKGEHYQ